jgi:hypothetical protein
VWLRALIMGMFGSRCDYATDFIKVCNIYLYTHTHIYIYV